MFTSLTIFLAQASLNLEAVQSTGPQDRRETAKRNHRQLNMDSITSLDPQRSKVEDRPRPSPLGSVSMDGLANELAEMKTLATTVMHKSLLRGVHP